MSIVRVLFLVLGSAGLLDSAIISSLSNLNLGTVLPAALGLPLLLTGIFYGKAMEFFRTPGPGAALRWLLIAGYALFFAAMAVVVPLIYSRGHSACEPGADVLIVLGCGVRGERPSLTLMRRCDAAYAYAVENPDTVLIVTGGKGCGEDIAEGEAMRRYLSAKGIAPERIRVEDRATSTHENFLFSKEIVDGEFPGGAKVVFVTTRFHVLRASRVAASAGLAADGMGADGVWYIAPNDYMREVFALIYYFIMGRL